MAAGTLAVAASPALDPRWSWAGTIRQATNQLALATPPPRRHVALMPNYLVEEDLARGILICPYEGDGQVAQSYHLVWPKRDRIKPAVRKFRDWLAGQVEGEDPYPR